MLSRLKLEVLRFDFQRTTFIELAIFDFRHDQERTKYTTLDPVLQQYVHLSQPLLVRFKILKLLVYVLSFGLSFNLIFQFEPSEVRKIITQVDFIYWELSCIVLMIRIFSSDIPHSADGIQLISNQYYNETFKENFAVSSLIIRSLFSL